jgi:alpha-amylase
MKLICFCVRLPISVIFRQYRFFDINNNDLYFDTVATQDYVKSLAYNNILPFFENLEIVTRQFGDKFKIAVSISGIAVDLLHKYAPEVIELMRSPDLAKSIEFLSEPWSHSILPYFDRESMVAQTIFHRETIQRTFGKIPSVFVAHSPVFSDEWADELKNCGTTAIFGYRNLNDDRKKQPDYEIPQDDSLPFFLINHSLSQKLQSWHLVNEKKQERTLSMSFIRYLKKHVSLVKPLIIFCNPLQKSLSENPENFIRWKNLISYLLNETGSLFVSPSYLCEISNHIDIDIDYSYEMLSNFRLPDLWLKNRLQQEVFKRTRELNDEVKNCGNSLLTENWRFLQDMETLYYMDDHFFDSNYSEQNFNPFQSPYEAFINYMNILDDFSGRIKVSQEANMI